MTVWCMHSFVVILFVDDVNLEQHCMHWSYNDVQLQRVVSRFCGRYCIIRSRGINVRSIVISFTRNTGFDDVLVRGFVCVQ